MNTPTLQQLQRWMKSHIQPSGVVQKEEFGSPLNAQGPDAGERRLSVYAEGYFVRIREALAELYEAVHHVLGDRSFTELARAYAVKYPSHDYNLSFSGRHLSDFLTQTPLAQQLPFLPELAYLEWQVSQAFHAFDLPSLDERNIAALPLEEWKRAQIVFQPSVAVVQSAWPIFDIWKSRTMPREKVDIDLVNRPQQVVVYRSDVQVRCELIDEREYFFLKELLAGRRFGDVCEEMTQTAEEGSIPMTGWFSRWIGNGLILRIQGGA